MSTGKKTSSRRWQTLLAIVIGIALLAAVVLMVQKLIKGGSDKPKKQPQISLIPTTPPPPPPPPKEEKKPEPPREKDQKEVKMVQQNDEPKQQAAPDPQLKMEGAAGDGPSAFASGKVSSEDLSRIGSGTGGAGGMGSSGAAFNNYAGLMKSELQRLLARRNELKRRNYRIEIRVWVASDGAVRQSELLGTSGDADIDDSIRQAISALPPFSEPPPANMPQPIRLRVTGRGRA